MKKTLTALIATAVTANATIVHLFENEDINLRITVENFKINDYTDPDTGRELVNHNAARFKVEICQTAPFVRLNSVYYRMNHGNLNGEWQSDQRMKEVDYFDSDWLDVADMLPDPNPFGSSQTNPAFRPHLTADQGRGSYNFTNLMTVNGAGNTNRDADNDHWFDENFDGGDSWLMYNEEDGSGSESIGEWKFDVPMSIVYSTQMGSTTVIKALGNFTTPLKTTNDRSQGRLMQDRSQPVFHRSLTSVPEPSSALLTLLAALGTLRRNRKSA